MLRRLSIGGAFFPLAKLTFQGSELPSSSTPAMSSTVRDFCSSQPLMAMKKFRGRKPVRRREAKEGDWICQCSEVNFRSKRECYKCGAPAPPLPPGVRRPSLPGEDPNDWACPCGQMNFRGSVNCYKCLQPKPVAPVAPGMEVTMWTCPKCRGVNRSSRKFCFKCNSASPNTAQP